MNTKIADLMAKRVITAQPHHSIEHVRGLMQRNRIHSVPVVGPEDVALGIVTSADLAVDLKAATPVQHVMSDFGEPGGYLGNVGSRRYMTLETVARLDDPEDVTPTAIAAA